MTRRNNQRGSGPDPVELKLDVDHPSQEGWWASNIAELEEADLQRLTVRFGRSGEDVAVVAGAMYAATLQMAARRLETERAESAKLAVLGEAELERYRQLAGAPLLVGEYVAWIMQAAGSVFAKPGGKKPVTHVSLELGGKLQRGDWEGAKGVDELEYSVLPMQLAAMSLRVQALNRRQAQRSYTFMPVYGSEASNDTKDFRCGVVSRARPSMVVSDAEGREARIFKRSLAVVVMSQLPEKDQVFIRRMFAENGVKYGLEVDSSAAHMAGRAFERAVEARGKSTEIVPVSANLLVVADRPSVVA